MWKYLLVVMALMVACDKPTPIPVAHAPEHKMVESAKPDNPQGFCCWSHGGLTKGCTASIAADDCTLQLTKMNNGYLQGASLRNAARLATARYKSLCVQDPGLCQTGWDQAYDAGDESPTHYTMEILPSIYCFQGKDGQVCLDTLDGCKASQWKAFYTYADRTVSACAHVTKNPYGPLADPDSFKREETRHQAAMMVTEANIRRDNRQFRWKDCRDQANKDMDRSLMLNCKTNNKKGTYQCPRSFLMHREDLLQKALDACDRACPTCMVDD